MNSVITFLKDFCLLLYLCIKPLFLLLIPKSLFYKALKDEIVLITGGGCGLGRLLAIKLSTLGCKVVIWDVNEKGGQETVNLIRENGGKGYFYSCDVADRKNVYMTAIKVADEVGPVSILINNAGVVFPKAILDCPDPLIEKTFGVNIMAHFWTVKAFLPGMIAKRCGHIVNISSLAGETGLYRLSSYCSSKSAAIGFYESLYIELKKDKYNDIRTTLVCTWHLDTKMFRGAGIGLIPPLETSYVAERIISAIRSNEDVIILPWYINILLVLKSLFPLPVVVKCMEMFGLYNSLDNFIGHGE